MYYYYYEMNRKLRQRTIIEWFLWIPASSSQPHKLSGTCAEALSCDSQPVCGGVRELFAITLPTPHLFRITCMNDNSRRHIQFIRCNKRSEVCGCRKTYECPGMGTLRVNRNM